MVVNTKHFKLNKIKSKHTIICALKYIESNKVK